jgi:hypothetical protein
MQRNGVRGWGTEQAALVIPGRCFPEVKGEHVARKSFTNEKKTRNSTASTFGQQKPLRKGASVKEVILVAIWVLFKMVLLCQP